MDLLLPLSLALPLCLALGLGICWRRAALALAPALALPALVLAGQSGLEIQLPWLLLGMRLGVDGTGSVLLLLAGLLWTSAGLYARGYLAADPARARFQFYFLLTYAGNLGTLLALDAASFYLFFTLMTFAAYGLIVHDGSAEARRAGGVYLILAVAGEVALLAALLLIASSAGNPDLRALPALLAASPQRDLIIGLILGGFAIKMGTVPLHVWLPLAHPCAPTPASAVLSGIIIKAGLLGCLRFLPLGETALPDWGLLCAALGLLSAFYAVLAGLPQVRPKTVLAYSSISQMGLSTALLGIGLGAPEHWPLILTTLLLFMLHHGLAKAALFLGVGVVGGGAAQAFFGLVLPALALAGAPLTSGALAKLLIKDLAPLTPGGLAEAMPLLLALSSGATALLMARFLYVVWPGDRPGTVSAWLWLPWLALLAAVAWLPWWWAAGRVPELAVRALAPGAMASNLWIIAAAGVLGLAGGSVGRRLRLAGRIPEGDLLHPLARLAARPGVGRAPDRTGATPPAPSGFSARAAPALTRGERSLRSWAAVGMVFLGLAIGLFGLLWHG